MNNIEVKKSQDWTKKMKKKSEIKYLLKQLGWTHIVVKKIKTKSKRNMTRRTMIVDAFNWQSKQNLKFIIDVKIGLPCWEQMMDVTFHAGVDCNIKIVVFDGVKVKEPGFFASYDENIALDFSKLNNSYGIKTYLLKTQQIVNDNNTNFDIIEKPGVLNSHDPKEHPSEEQFKRAEYWVLFHDIDSVVHFYISGNPQSWFNFQFYNEFNDIGFLAYWNELGFFLDIIAQSQLAMRTVNSIFTNFEKEGKKKYCPELIFDGKGEEPLTWNLTLSKKSYHYFYGLSPRDKKSFAGFLDYHLLDINSWFWEDDDEF